MEPRRTMFSTATINTDGRGCGCKTWAWKKVWGGQGRGLLVGLKVILVALDCWPRHMKGGMNDFGVILCPTNMLSIEEAKEGDLNVN